jgi:hypothetical protein
MCPFLAHFPSVFWLVCPFASTGSEFPCSLTFLPCSNLSHALCSTVCKCPLLTHFLCVLTIPCLHLTESECPLFAFFLSASWLVHPFILNRKWVPLTCFFICILTGSPPLYLIGGKCPLVARFPFMLWLISLCHKQLVSFPYQLLFYVLTCPSFAFNRMWVHLICLLSFSVLI